MISRSKAQKIIEAAVEYAGRRVDGVEASLSGSDVATSRFANNQMTQNQSPQSDHLSVRIVRDGRQIRLSGDDLSLKGIKSLVDSAIEVVDLLERDPHLAELHEPDRKQLTDVEQRLRYRLDRKVLAMDADDRADAVSGIIATAEGSGLETAGVVASGQRVEAIGNSRGLFVYHSESLVECSITMVTGDSSGWSKAQGPLRGMVDARALAGIASEKALLSASPGEIAPGRYTAILEPAAVLDLIHFLLWDFAATSHLDKRSCLLDRLSERVFGENINIVDDVFHEEQSGAPFDGEGVPRQAVTLVENGVLKNLVYGPRSAARSGEKPTGHGLPEPTAMGEYPCNIVIEGGDVELPDMIASCEKGVLLSRVWYVREVDPARKILTGMTRDGTFWVEDGAIKYGVRNLRFNVNLVELLNNVIALSPARRTAGEEGFPAVVPAMKVEGFNFTEVTRF